MFLNKNAIMTLEFDELYEVWDPYVFATSSLKTASKDYKLKFGKTNIGDDNGFLVQ